jgi:hypothetical protein
MTTRILELLDQAISEVDYIREDDNTNEQLQKMFIPDFLAERFAQLIVQECCNTGAQWATGLFDPKHYSFVNKKIKEHFEFGAE